ncbi:MAG: DUF2625 domain-containing protein [Methylophilaceae bacterium]
MRTLEELINKNDTALKLINEWANASESQYEILPASDQSGKVLYSLQISTRSTMGAVAYETGGILIEHGWLRILGSGHPKLTRNLIDWNENRTSGYLLIADDAVGGFFAINSGGFGEDIGNIYYWAPDSLLWEPLDIGYSDFLNWAFSENLANFYSDLRWPSWVLDIKTISADQCFNFVPFLWTKEGSIESSSRRAVSIFEQFSLNKDFESS